MRARNYSLNIILKADATILAELSAIRK